MSTKLVVQSDDFGMSNAGNEGVVQAFENGILTQASVMVACPWFRGAATLAKEHSIPVGVHLMATSEWEFYRWGPLTGGTSLRAEDGRFPRTIEQIREQADPDDLLEEFVAQVEAFRAEGLEPEYFDCHMGVIAPEPYVEICRRYGKPFDYPVGDVAVGFDSIHMVSSQPVGEKMPYLLDRISALEEGKHLFVTHCAVDSPELRAQTSETAKNRAWANEYRPSDLAGLTSAEVKELVEERGIELVSVGRL